MNPTLVKVAGAGRAYQSVAQSAAIAIQDGTDYLRNVSTIATTAIGVGIAQLAAGEPKGAALITQAQSLVSNTVNDYTLIGQAAIKIATDFPRSFT